MVKAATRFRELLKAVREYLDKFEKEYHNYSKIKFLNNKTQSVRLKKMNRILNAALEHPNEKVNNYLKKLASNSNLSYHKQKLLRKHGGSIGG